MSLYLLDTNVISELRKAGEGRANAGVVAWMSGVEAADLYLSAVTVMELELGILRVERRDAVQGAMLRAWMEARVMPEFGGRILALDAAVARVCAGLHVPDPRAERDAYIAATAIVHGMAVVTRNVADFVATGVRVVDPWLAKPGWCPRNRIGRI